ncbi:MAG TPA: hypothetical protein VJ890_01035 [Vineibacter sp.]|nr:hypothetical protein [Vineibacter sp.]
MYPDDDRVVTLFEDARRRFGDDILRDPRRAVPMIADKAPELRDTIKSAAAAMGLGAAQRLRSAPDQTAEFHRLAAEVGGREGVSFADAVAGLRIAMRVAGGGSAPGMQADRSWVGATAVAGAGMAGPGSPGFPPQAPGGPPAGYGAPPPAGQSFSWRGWGIAAVVGVVILAVVGLSAGPEKQAPPGPQAGPPPSAPPSGGQPQGGGPPPAGGRPPPPQQSAGLPIIVPPGGGQTPPAIAVREAEQMYVLQFGASGGGQVLRVTVGISKQQGWGAGIVLVGTQGAQEPETASRPGAFVLNNEGGNAIRVLQPQWQQDRLNIGTICVAFVQPNARDVQLRGSNVCVLASNCNQMVGCGTVQ